MKQQVLFSLAGAADVIDQRPRSFELYGCATCDSPACPRVAVQRALALHTCACEALKSCIKHDGLRLCNTGRSCLHEEYCHIGINLLSPRNVHDWSCCDAGMTS